LPPGPLLLSRRRRRKKKRRKNTKQLTTMMTTTNKPELDKEATENVNQYCISPYRNLVWRVH
jgi:hypothetical protein